MKQNLFSAPEEEYLIHVDNALKILEQIIPTYDKTLERIFSTPIDVIKEALTKMIILHDLGKLTKRWQEGIRRNENSEMNKLPSHASLGAAALFKILPEKIREPLCFAVSIHHIDRGIIGNNIEKPDSQAILEGIIDLEGKVIWHNEAHTLSETYFPEEARKLTVYDMREMALRLRFWALGEGILIRHTRRIQAMLAHHLLKLCDIYSARERKTFVDNEIYFGGSAMIKEIENYVENLLKRRT